MSETLPLRELELKSRGAGVIFHIVPTDEFLFFLRDDKPTISCPNMVDIIGGHMDEGETPEETARREVAEELVDNNTSEPFDLGEITHFKTFVDDRPGEHNIFGCELDSDPDIRITEGQGLVRLSREQALSTNFAYGYSDVVREYVESLSKIKVRGLRLEDVESIRPILDRAIVNPLTKKVIQEEIEDTLIAMRDSIGGKNGRTYVVAETPEGNITGVMGLQEPDEIMEGFASTDNPVELINAYVDYDSRGTGTGRALVRHLESLARQRGYTEVILNSGPRFRWSGWPFWRKIYGEPIGVAKDFYGPRFDAMIWGKPLS